MIDERVKIHDGLRIFKVDKRSDWAKVVNYLLTLATGKPLTHAEANFYSKNLKEVQEKVQRLADAGREGEALEYSAGVQYKGVRIISLCFTLEPKNFHLSAVEVLGPMLFNRLPNKIAREIGEMFLGTYEERKEGAISEVRHFYQKFN